MGGLRPIGGRLSRVMALSLQVFARRAVWRASPSATRSSAQARRSATWSHACPRQWQARGFRKGMQPEGGRNKTLTKRRSGGFFRSTPGVAWGDAPGTSPHKPGAAHQSPPGEAPGEFPGVSWGSPRGSTQEIPPGGPPGGSSLNRGGPHGIPPGDSSGHLPEGSGGSLFQRDVVWGSPWRGRPGGSPGGGHWGLPPGENTCMDLPRESPRRLARPPWALGIVGLLSPLCPLLPFLNPRPSTTGNRVLLGLLLVGSPPMATGLYHASQSGRADAIYTACPDVPGSVANTDTR